MFTTLQVWGWPWHQAV